MNLLEDGLSSGSVIETKLTRKLTIDGITNTYPVYKVKLDRLYFNDRNDRIATRLTQYKFEQNISKLDLSDKEKYNEIIHSFIKNSNLEAYKKTKTNISLVEQREPGVVLYDGRIVDGNRRFTCLRELAKENPKFGYFETVILDKNIENYEKEIKMLELMIQHGEESKLDYDPIDRLVGVYYDLIKNKLLTVKEYANSVNLAEKEIEKQKDIAQLVEDFLVFMNAPEKFFIAKDLQIDGPILELYGVVKKISDVTKQENIKNIAFAHLAMKTSEDPTRYIRKMKKIAATPYLDEFIDDSIEVVEKVVDGLPTKADENTISDLRADTETKNSLKKVMDKVITKAESEETRDKPLQDLEKAKNIIESVNTDIFIKLDRVQIEAIQNMCQLLTRAITTVESCINV